MSLTEDEVKGYPLYWFCSCHLFESSKYEQMMLSDPVVVRWPGINLDVEEEHINDETI